MQGPADSGEVAERVARHAERPGFRISAQAGAVVAGIGKGGQVNGRCPV